MKNIVAIDVGGTKIAGAVLRYDTADKAPEITLRRAVPTDAARGGAAVMETIVGLATQLVDECGAAIDAIGVGTAGRVDATTGGIAFANDLMPGWTGTPVRQVLEDRLGLPCAVLNDVQAHALGEARWGAANGAREVVVVAAGTGLGGAIITGGAVMRGTHGFAGELGHTVHPAAAGITCACGGTAHLETVASGSGIEDRYFDATQIRRSGVEISQLANEGDEAAVAVIRQAGRALGEAIASWVNMLDPQMIIVSGSVVKAGAIWRDALDEGYGSQMQDGQNKPPVVEATLGGDAPLVGAAENALDMLNSR